MVVRKVRSYLQMRIQDKVKKFLQMHYLSLFKALGNKIDLVFLNACYSEKQAKAIAQHVNCVIGMSNAVSDTTAIEFASMFYFSLGFKKSVKEAFDLALFKSDCYLFQDLQYHNL